MFEDISKSIKATLYERIGSPLYSTYAIAWCIVNYDVFLLLTASKLDVVKKIKLINYSLHGEWVNTLHTYGVPVIISGFAILLFPWLNQRIYEMQLVNQKR
jgi:hypothetical protein